MATYEGAAVISTLVWLRAWERCVQRGTDRSSSKAAFEVVTGWGKNSRVRGVSEVKDAVDTLLRSMDSPFVPAPHNAGCLTASSKDVREWMRASREGSVLQSADDARLAAVEKHIDGLF